jgi:hypothetical protein
MKDIQPLVQNRAAEPGFRLEGRRTAVLPASARLTNFYPLYGAANDQVDAVLRVQPVQFQRIIPRYRLSTSETRDQGLGPMFAGIPETPAQSFGRTAALAGDAGSPESGRRAARAEAETARNRPAVREPWLGGQIDLYA